jgi:nitrogenase molybdenum-iron protein beta chain
MALRALKPDTISSEESTNQRCLEAPKYTCSLGGALALTTNINRVIPIIHAGAGCGQNQLLSYRTSAGRQGIGYLGGVNAPSSNMSETEVVFGGETRLRDQVQGTLDMVNGDAYVIISGCIAAMIGDDIESVARDFNTPEHPVLAVATSGFAGNAYTGYEAVLEAFINQFITEKKTVPKTVNILGVVPYQDLFWRGNLKVLRELLGKIGVKVNQIAGDKSGVEGIQNLSAAELTVVLSPWVGVNAAKLLEEKFGVPYITFPWVPVGPIDSTEFLTKVARKLKIPKSVYGKVIKAEEDEAYENLNIAGDTLTQFSAALPYAIVANTSTALGLTRFLTNLAGYTATTVIINDDPPEEVRNLIHKQLENLASGLHPKILFEVDSWQIREELKKSNFRVLLASSQERYVAERENKLFLSVSFPANNRLIVKETYAGYNGGFGVVEQVMSQFIMP